MDPTRIFCRLDIDVTPEYSHQIILKNIIPLSFDGSVNLINNNNNNKRHQKHQKDKPDKFYLSNLSPFSLLSAYELAAIDMYFNLTTHSSGSIAPQLLKAQTYVITHKDLGFLDYLQYRNPLTFMFLLDNIETTETENNYIVYERIKQIKKNDDFSNIDFYIQQILITSYEGVDIFLLNDYKSIHELITLIIIMLKTLKTNGTSVIKLKNIHEDVIQLMSYLFDHIFLFKSATSNINDDQYYLIGKFFNKNKSANIINFLSTRLQTSLEDNLLFNIDINVSNYIEKIKYTVRTEIEDNPIYVPEKLKIYLNIQ